MESLIAVGDDFGKIYIIHNTKQLIVQTLHWHAHRVNALRFIAGSPYLLSGGEEAVIVQWHLETQSKTFISRLGAAITSIGLSSPSHSYYSVNLGDNSSKIVRFDNNKVKAHLNSVQFDQNGLEQAVFQEGGVLAVPFKNELQFYQVDERTVQSLVVKARNYTSKGDMHDPPSTHIKSFGMTPDRKHLVTFEELVDKNSHKSMRFSALKFWSREAVEEDVTGFELKQLVHDPCSENDEGIKITVVSIKHVLIVSGAKIQAWTLNEAGKWEVQAEFGYQGLPVVETHAKVRLRLQGVAKRCLALLHKGGLITFWNQDTYEYSYQFRLNC